jgi:hypothetical protein
MLLFPRRCYGAWFHSNSSCSELTMLLRKRFHSSCSCSEWTMLLRKRFNSSCSCSEWTMLLRKRFNSSCSCSEWTMLLRKRFHSSCSCSEWEILLGKLETLMVCRWCFRIRCGGRVCSTAGRLLENRLHCVVRCLAVCTSLSGLQVGEDVFFILWRYERKLPWFVRNCVRVKFGHREKESLWSMVCMNCLVWEAFAEFIQGVPGGICQTKG